MFEKIQYKYYDIVPYDYRPKQLIYKLKCFLWKRYSTVKSRHLDHTWCDKIELIPYTLFEMLEDFVEKECGPNGCTEWYGEYGHKILVGMEYKYVRDEIDTLLAWWNEVYLPYTKGKLPEQIRLDNESREYNELLDKFWFPTENQDLTEFDPERELGKEKYEHYMSINHQGWALEAEMESQLETMCHRIIRIRRYLWT